MTFLTNPVDGQDLPGAVYRKRHIFSINKGGVK